MAPYTLYTAATPNGYKPSIVLEELGLEYAVKVLNIQTNEQKEEWFLKINPNGRIPALVDHEDDDLAVFESGAIMLHLVEKHDVEGKIWPKDRRKRSEVLSWLMFQMGGLGPMQGQANHFVRAAPEKILYGMTRYLNETERLYGVLERGLEGKEWLAAGQYTIADIANYAWVRIHAMCGARVDDKPNLCAWMARIGARPAVQKGCNVPPRKLPANGRDVINNPEDAQAAIDEVAAQIKSLASEQEYKKFGTQL